MEEKKVTIEELAVNKEFLEKVSKLNSVEEITYAINKEGVEITVEEMEQALDIFLAHQEDDEVNENVLENVVGGISHIVVGGIMIWTAISGIVGVIHGFVRGVSKQCK